MKTAIFDIDGTLFRSSLLIELTEEMIASELFPKEAATEYQKEKEEWLNRNGPYEDYIGAVVKTFIKHLKGIHYGDFMEVSKKVAEREGNKLYRYTRDLLPQLKKRGYFLLAVSQSPKGTLDAFSKNLGFDKVYGRIYQTGPENRFTGEVEDLQWIANKANIVRRAINKEDLTLEGSIGVGDTEDDLPLLELVEYPICFNPNRELYRQARRRGWAVVVERKDVIYPILKPDYLEDHLVSQ